MATKMIAGLDVGVPPGDGRVPEEAPPSWSSTVPVGGIIAYSGLLADVLPPWHICDGTSGTPDLRNVFLKGADVGADAGATGKAAAASTDAGDPDCYAVVWIMLGSS